MTWRIKKLEEIFLDMRPRALRMSHEDIALDRKWSSFLGFTREQVLLVVVWLLYMLGIGKGFSRDAR